MCVSSCGNFGLLGNVHGWIDRYNMQSGLHRGSYIDDTIGRAHTGSIQGLVTDALNRTLISAGLDGYLKVVSTGNCLIRLVLGLCIAESATLGEYRISYYENSVVQGKFSASCGV